MATQEIRLPPPYKEAPNASEQEQDEWEAAINAFVTNLVIYKLSQGTTAAQLFLLFDAPEHQPLLFYYACANLLRATRELTSAAEHIALIAALFGLLKEEGLKRDGPNGENVFGNSVVFPVLRGLADDIPAPPGYSYNQVTFLLEQNPEYVKESDDVFLAALAQYGREREGLIRLWSLVGRLEAESFLGEPGGMSLLYHQAPLLLSALEDPDQRGVWETLWAAVLRCDEEMAYGEWGAGDTNGWLGPFKDAVRKIAEDERPSLEWRGRFAVILEELEADRDHPSDSDSSED